ncbi:MAG: hypothetical protein OK449_01305 [Thaumarchaeota archaeon]|nr:hypothetical protein [Nitrososphaerota archaeon]
MSLESVMDDENGSFENNLEDVLSKVVSGSRSRTTAAGEHDHRKTVPPRVLGTKEDRVFVAAMIGTEGSITSSYDKEQRQTELVLRIDMTDREWVAKFAATVGLSAPPTVGRYHGEGHKRIFSRNPQGLRALIILHEILPYLCGTKKVEAQRAIDFFSPTGYKKGEHRADEIYGGIEGRSKRSDLKVSGSNASDVKC